MLSCLSLGIWLFYSAVALFLVQLHADLLFMLDVLVCLHSCNMDVLGFLPVRFFYNGEFIRDGKMVHYCGGSQAMSYIDRDKVSLPE